MDSRGSTLTGGAILMASALTTLMAPLLMSWVGRVIGGGDLFGGIGLLLIVAFYAPQAMIVVFLAAVAAGAALQKLRVQHILIYGAAGSLVGLLGVGVLTLTALLEACSSSRPKAA